MNKQDLLDKDLATFLEKNGIDRSQVTVRPMAKKITGTEILCAICCSVIASAIWDGIKWVWTRYSHSCSGTSAPTPPKPSNPEPPEEPSCCALCGEQIRPGKKHNCK